MEHKTIYQMIGNRDDFRFIRVATHLEPQEVKTKLGQFKSSGLLTFVRPQGITIKTASDFSDSEQRSKYFQMLMGEYFGYEN